VQACHNKPPESGKLSIKSKERYEQGILQFTMLFPLNGLKAPHESAPEHMRTYDVVLEVLEVQVFLTVLESMISPTRLPVILLTKLLICSVLKRLGVAWYLPGPSPDLGEAGSGSRFCNFGSLV
jgi:hypothetical protein